MSTILKSLRKLEDEKSVLDKKIKLKELVIQEDKGPKEVEEEREPPRQWWSGLLLIFGGIAVGVTAVWLMQPAADTTQTTKITEPATETHVRPEQGEATAREEVLQGGVRLSSIPDFTNRPERDDAGVIIEEDVEPLDPVPGSMASTAPVSESISASNESIQPVAEPAGQTTLQRPEAAGDQIVSALSSVPTQTRSAISPAPQVQFKVPVEVVQEIPGLKIKGIIFFGENSPENYLFFTVPEAGGIHRLKVGESVSDAKLLEIHPGRAVFEYHDRPVELQVRS